MNPSPLFLHAPPMEQQRRVNRTLTAKYDMGSLRQLQKLETDFLASLSSVYGCEEDDVPLELDLLEVYNMEEAVRPAALVSIRIFVYSCIRVSCLVRTKLFEKWGLVRNI